MTPTARAAVVVLTVLPLATGCATLSRTDPIEPVNRASFAFNDTFDQWLLAPAARGWDWLTPHFVQQGVANFYGNLDMPMVILNDLLVLRVGDAAEDSARLLVNTTVGVVGFIDVAGRIGIPRNDADFGLTLGRWGLPPGPYLVVPFIGPLSTRDGVGYVGDIFAHPHIYFVPFWTTFIVYTTRAVNFRAMAADDIEEARAEALDYYVFVRNAYLQNRQSRVEDRRQPTREEEEDLYYFEEEEGEEEPE